MMSCTQEQATWSCDVMTQYWESSTLELLTEGIFLIRRLPVSQKIKKFKVLTNESTRIYKYLIDKQSSLGPMITRIPIEFKHNGKPTKYANIANQH